MPVGILYLQQKREPETGGLIKMRRIEDKLSPGELVGKVAPAAT